MSKEAVYPDLLIDVRAINSRFPFGPKRLAVSHHLYEIEHVARTGDLLANFAVDPRTREETEGWYSIAFNREEAREFILRTGEFLLIPGVFNTYAEALGGELEDLVCGGRPERYTKMELPLHQRWALRLREWLTVFNY